MPALSRNHRIRHPSLSLRKCSAKMIIKNKNKNSKMTQPDYHQSAQDTQTFAIKLFALLLEPPKKSKSPFTFPKIPRNFWPLLNSHIFTSRVLEVVWQGTCILNLQWCLNLKFINFLNFIFIFFLINSFLWLFSILLLYDLINSSAIFFFYL